MAEAPAGEGAAAEPGAAERAAAAARGELELGVGGACYARLYGEKETYNIIHVPCTIGRSTADAEAEKRGAFIRISDQKVSRVHATIKYIKGQWLMDVPGKNGAIIDGEL